MGLLAKFMKKRLLVFSLIVIFLVLVYFAPNMPLVKNYILGQIAQVAQNQGFTLGYDKASGNFWTNLNLEGVTVTSDNVDLSLSDLDLSYNPLFLIRRQLPLSLALDGLSGTLELMPLVANRNPASSAISVQLKELNLSNAQLELLDLPYTLPDLSIDKVKLQPRGNEYLLDASLSTSEGALETSGVFALNPFRLDLNVSQADASIARRWWKGINAGSASGTVRVDEQGLVIDALFTDGAITFFKETAENISGSAKYQKGIVTATFEGESLGALATVLGKVDIPERNWSANASGDVNVAHTLTWLSQNWLPKQSSQLGITGTSAVAVQASGWRSINLRGSSLGQAELRGLDFENLTTHFSLVENRNFSLDASTTLNEQPITASFQPQEQGFLLNAQGEQLEFLANSLSDLSFQLERKEGNLTALGTLKSNFNQLNRDISSNVSTRLEDGVWLFDVAASDELQESLVGQFQLEGQTLSGKADFSNLVIPQINEQLSGSLNATGPLNDLALNLDVVTPKSLSLSAFKLSAENTFSGTISAKLNDYLRLSALSVALGPLSAEGSVDFQNQTANLSYALEPLSLAGLVNTELQMTNGKLSWLNEEFSQSGLLSLADLTTTGVRVEELSGPLNLSFGEAVSGSFQSTQGLNANLINNKLELSFSETALFILNERIELSGTTGLSLDEPLADLAIDINLSHPLASLALRNDGAMYDGTLITDYGSLAASYDLESAALSGTGAILDLPLSLSGIASLESLDTQLSIDNSLLANLSGSLRQPVASLGGQLALTSLASRYGIATNAVAEPSLNIDLNGAQGSLSILGDVQTIPIAMLLNFDGFAITATANALPFGISTKLAGSLYPKLNLAASFPYGSFSVEQINNDIILSGQGETPLLSQAGWVLSEQAWRAQGSLNTQTLALELPNSSALLSLNSDGWWVSSQLNEQANNGENSLTIVGEFVASSEMPLGQLNSSLTLKLAEQSHALGLSGSLDLLKLNGKLPASDLTALLALPVDLVGLIDLDATFNALNQTYSANAIWQSSAPEPLTISVKGQRQTLSADLKSETLNLSYAHSKLVINANQFKPDPYLKTTLFDLSLDGAVEYSPESQWLGSLQASATETLELNAELIASGDALFTSGELGFEQLAATFSGSLLPFLDVAVASDLFGYADLQGQLTGSFSDPFFNAILDTKLLSLSEPALELEAQRFQLSSNFQAASLLNITSNSLTASLKNGVISGSLNLPFVLENEAHFLAGDLTGDLVNPLVTARVIGAIANGPLSLSRTQLNTNLDLSLMPFLNYLSVDSLNKALITEAMVKLNGQLNSDLRWQSQITADAKYDGLPLNLAGQASGNALNLSLNAVATIDDQPLAFDLNFDNQNLELSTLIDSFNISPLAALFNVPIQGLLSGPLSYSEQQGLVTDLQFAGSAYGLAITATGSYRTADLNLTVMLDQITTQLSSSDLVNFNLEGSSTYEAYAGEFTGTILRQDGFSLNILGYIANQAASLQASYPQEGLASLNLQLAKAQLNAEYERLSGAIKLFASKPEALFVQPPLSLESSLNFLEGKLKLNNLTLASSLSSLPISLNARGKLWPKTAVQGQVELSDYLVNLTLNREEQTLLLSALYEQLELQSTLSQNFNVLEASLIGKARWSQGLTAAFNSNLAWSAETGYAGRASLSAAQNQWSSQLELFGDSQLQISGEATALDSVVASVNAFLPADFTEPLSGSIALRADLAALLPSSLLSSDLLNLSAGLVLQSELELSGELLNPYLSGSAVLTGALESTGAISANLEAVDLALNSETFQLNASIDTVSWQARFESSQLDLAELVALDDLHLSSRLNAEQQWGKPLSLTASQFNLSSKTSSLTGTASFAKDWQGRFNSNIQLKDFIPNSSGTINAEVQLSSLESNPTPQISATLEFLKLGFASNGESSASLSGEGIVTGALFEPAISLSLQGEGSASGALLAVLEPARARYTLTSSLTVAGFRSQLDVFLSENKAQAQGDLSYGDFRLRASEVADTAVLAFDGLGRLDGWSLGLNFASRDLSLVGLLSSLDERLSGELNAEASLTNPEAALTGSITNAGFANSNLGDIRLLLPSWQSPELQLMGENLLASVFLSSNLRWSLKELNTSLTDQFTVGLTGEGSRTQGYIIAELRSHLHKESLRLSASYLDNRFSFSSDDTFLNGTVKIFATVTPDEAWQGSFSLKELELYGASISAEGGFLGDFLNPMLTAETLLEYNNLSLEGSLSAELGRLSFEQNFDATWLNDPLMLSASLADSISLNLYSQSDSQGLQLGLRNGLISASGSLSLITQAGTLKLAAGSTDWLELSAVSKSNEALAIALAVNPLLMPASSVELFQQNQNLVSLEDLRSGLRLSSLNSSVGSIDLNFQPNLQASFNNFELKTPYATLIMRGQVVRQTTWQVDLNLDLEELITLPWLSQIPLLETLADESFQLSLNDSKLNLSSSSEQIKISSSLALSEALIDINLSNGSEMFFANLSFLRDEGFRGGIVAENLSLLVADTQASINLDANVLPEAVRLTGVASLGEATLSISADYGLADLPVFLAPLGRNTQSLSGRLGVLPLQSIPWVAQNAPNLEGGLSASLQLRQNRLIAQFVSPDLAIEDNHLPLNLTLNGSLDDLELSATLGRSRLTGNATLNSVEGLFLVESFPAEAPAEAIFGKTNVDASLTGVLRFKLPYQDIANSEIRFASEFFTLKQNDTSTVGSTSFSYADKRFVLNPTTFTGTGTWQAGGVISEDELQLNFSALNANFSPILSLIPQLSSFEPQAFGSLNLDATGNLAKPTIRLSSSNIELSLSGSQYELNNVLASLENETFNAQGILNGVSPITGRLELLGEGRISFLPSFASDLSFSAEGDATIPTLGSVEQIQAAITYQEASGWILDSTGVLGSPYTLNGALRPLDLDLIGQNLNLIAAQYFLVSSQADVDLNVAYLDRRFAVTGDVFTKQANLNSSQREARTRSNRPRPRVLSLIDFNDVTIRAPREVLFTANVGNAELSVDTILRGTAAQPTLEGRAQSVRGSFRFAGRNFTLSQAFADFQPSRGIYPSLSINAFSSFTKASVTRGSQISFIEPSTGADFNVYLSFTGEIIPTPNEARAFNIDLQPTLSSDALIDDDGSVRTLSENELYSILTLGRIETVAELTGEGSVAESVGSGAIDTLVDTFILAELQKQLAEALGLDVLEIRTTPLSSLFTETDANFGVALLVGGYLSDELFASFEISNLSNDPSIVLSNEFNLRYELAPLELGLVGRLKLLNDAQGSTIPELGLNLAYAITPLIRLELGADVSNAAQSISFGVSFRW